MLKNAERSTIGLFDLAAPATLVQGVQHRRPRFSGAARAPCTFFLVLSRCRPSSALVLGFCAPSREAVSASANMAYIPPSPEQTTLKVVIQGIEKEVQLLRNQDGSAVENSDGYLYQASGK